MANNQSPKRLPETFGIRFGILNPKIAVQIKSQGLKYDRKEVAGFERSRDAIYSLLFGGIIVESQFDKMLIKLYNKILRHVGKANGCDVKPLKLKP